MYFFWRRPRLKAQGRQWYIKFTEITPHIQCWVLIVSCAVARTLTACSSVARAHVHSKIELSLETSSKNRRCLSIFDQKIQALAFKVLLVGGSNTELVALLIFENRAPARDILEISSIYVHQN